MPGSELMFWNPLFGRAVKCLGKVRSSDTRWLDGRLSAWNSVDISGPIDWRMVKKLEIGRTSRTHWFDRQLDA